MHRIVTGGRAGRLARVAVAVVLLGACGDDGDDGSTGETAPTTVNVLAGLNDQLDANIVVTEFLPEAASIVAGSTVTWRFVGPEPHSVTFLPPGQDPPAPGDESLFAPSTPAATTYDGTALANSGLLPAGTATPVPFSLTFPTEGEFAYVCVIHPLMTGKVTVAGTGATVDTQADINERADRELNLWLEEGRAAKTKLAEAGPRQAKNPDPAESSTWTYEMGVSTEHTDVQAFAPSMGEVRPGDSVTFVNNTRSPHTATFRAPANANPSGPPTGPSPLTVAPTGGPFNSGRLPPAAPPNAPPPEAARSFTFVLPEAGEYLYACLYHLGSQMTGSVKVA